MIVNFGSGANSAIRDAVLHTGIGETRQVEGWVSQISKYRNNAMRLVSGQSTGWHYALRHRDERHTRIEIRGTQESQYSIGLVCEHIHCAQLNIIQIQTYTQSHTFTLCNIRLVCAGWQAGIEARSPGLAHGPSVKSWSAQLTWKPDLHIFSTTWRRLSIGSISFVKKDR